MNHPDMLPGVIAELEKRKGDLRQLSTEVGIKYDTLLRIKNGEGDPGYSKVRHLAQHFGIVPTPQPTHTEAGE